MARTATITREQILEAARAVFLEQGFSATTVDVANRAGISSASIFKYFPTKEALFFSAMSDQSSERTWWTPELEAAIGHGDPRADLLLIAQKIASYTENQLPRIMLAWSVRQSGPPNPPNIQNDFAALASYLGREMALGRVARGDPTIPALTLLHTSVGFSMSKTLQSATALFNADRFLEDFVNTLWRGLDPKERPS